MTETGPTHNAKILVVESSRDAESALQNLLSNEGYTTIVASKVDGLETAECAAPDVVLVDLSVPELGGLDLCRSIKANPGTRDAAVIILSTITDTEIKARGLNVGANDFVEKPFRDVELVARIQAQLRLKLPADGLRQNYADVCERLKQVRDTDGDAVDQGSVVRETKCLICGNEVREIQGIVNQLLIGIHSRLSSRARNDLVLGLHEMILNAIEHGNLGISSGKKAEALESNNYDALIAERSADPQLAKKKVRIEYEFDGSGLRYRITDEGRGFDWQACLERDEPEDLLASNGRGILISRYIFDSVAYNEKGNEVELEKAITEKGRESLETGR